MCLFVKYVFILKVGKVVAKHDQAVRLLEQLS